MQSSVKAVLVLSLIFSSSCVPKQHILDKNYFIVDNDYMPWVIAHGGGQSLFPANTMMAFDGSMQMKVDALEMDVSLSKDTILVCHHDETIDRVTNGKSKIADLTFKELQSYNCAHNFVDIHGNMPYRDTLISIPALSEVFKKYGNSYMIVELKDKGERGKKAVDELIKLINEYSLHDKIIVASFHHDILMYFYKNSGKEIPISASKKEMKEFILFTKTHLGIFYHPKAVAFQLPLREGNINLATQKIVSKAHQRKIAIHYWTINDKKTMRQLINMGVDGIITDRPDLMIELRE